MNLSQEFASRRLPLRACQQSGHGDQRQASGAGADVSGKAEPLRIAVVEDEPFVRLDIEAALTAAGHQVVAVADTADGAVDAAERERPDLMIMDVRLLGGSDGVDAAIAIWERFGIRSLFASANLDAATRARAGRANPAGFVDKPFLNATLLAALPKKP
jgi:two-component system, response regulator PdtaR